MKEQKLTWRARGRLWFRIGIRLVLLLAGLWLLWKVGLPLLSLLAPFVAALITAAILHPVVRWLRSTLGGSRKLWSLLVLVLLFGLMGAALGGLIYAAGAQLISLVQSWDDLLANLEGIFQQLEQIFARFWDLVPPALNETVDSVWDSVLEWLKNTLPGMLEGLVNYAKDKALSLPSFGLALIIYIMASYLLTADYPDLRTAAARRTDRRLLAFLIQVRDTALAAAWIDQMYAPISEGRVSPVGGCVLYPAGRLLSHPSALRPAVGPGAGGDGLYPHHRRRDRHGALGGH